MAVTEGGRYTGTQVTETGEVVFNGLTESGAIYFPTTAAVVTVVVGVAFQPGAFQQPEGFQTTELPYIVVAAQVYGGEFQVFEPEEDQFWIPAHHESSLDALPAVLNPPVTEADEPKAAQWDNDGYLFDADEDWHSAVYGFPDPNGDLVAALFPPDVNDDFQAAQYPLAEQPWFPDQDIDTELQNDSTLEVIAQLFPPDVTTDFLATQPLAEQPWFPEQETEDYANDSTIDALPGYLAPNDAFDTTIATQPHYGELPIPPEETEDYANDSTVDTSWSMDFASGDEITIATEPLSEQPFFLENPEEDWGWQPYIENLEGFIAGPPNFAPDAEALAATQVFEQDIANQFPDPDPTNDQPLVDGAVEAFQSPNDAFDVTIATQYPLAEQPWFQDNWDEDWGFQPYVEQNEGFIAGPPLFPPDAEALAATQIFEQDIAVNFPDPDPTNDQNIVDGAVEAFQSPNDSFDVTIATQYPLAEQPWFPDQETEDYADSTNDEVVAQFAPGPDEIHAAQPLGEQPWFPDEQLDDANSFIEQNEAYLSIPIVTPDPFLTAVTEYRDGMGEFIPLDEWPEQPVIAEFWSLFAPSQIPPIKKVALWKPIVKGKASVTVPSKLVLWFPVVKGLASYSAYIARKAHWEDTDPGIGSVP